MLHRIRVPARCKTVEYDTCEICGTHIQDFALTSAYMLHVRQFLSSDNNTLILLEARLQNLRLALLQIKDHLSK
jgi:hypothetical protein